MAGVEILLFFVMIVGIIEHLFSKKHFQNTNVFLVGFIWEFVVSVLVVMFSIAYTSSDPEFTATGIALLWVLFPTMKVDPQSMEAVFFFQIFSLALLIVILEHVSELSEYILFLVFAIYLFLNGATIAVITNREHD